MKLSKYLKDPVTMPNGDISIVLTPEARYLAEMVKAKHSVPYRIGEDGSYHFVVPGGDRDMLKNLVGYIHDAHKTTSRSKIFTAGANVEWDRVRRDVFGEIPSDEGKMYAALEKDLRKSGVSEEKVKKILKIFRSEDKQNAS
jgi:hypothetical protein